MGSFLGETIGNSHYLKGMDDIRMWKQTQCISMYLIGSHYSATLDFWFACFVSYLAFSLSLLDMAVAYAIWLAGLFRWPNCRGVSDSACSACQMIPCWCQPEFLPRPAATVTLMWPLTTQPCVINGAISPTADSFQRTDWWWEKVQVAEMQHLGDMVDVVAFSGGKICVCV